TRRVPKEAFHPRPNVDSAVVTVSFGEGGFEVADARAYRETVRCAFQSRRKTLENNLMNCFRLSRERAREILAEAEIPAGVRGEALTPRDLARLSDVVSSMLK
ncbi:MAG: 16S rRNA (adenine(1518)-N(6)/adenine(1519)-N(6))-dimethyltransferase, partial [Lachnospiraceae bacterium]|nr:16S rRNA (adenine(1518)-N(6)/adenine(1519)-N(6))-dimethyltransferase [Lachnospiraceae bacterium]